MTERWTTGPQYLEGQEQALLSPDLPEGDDDAERQIADWLGRLRRLHGVPFHFLVPDARMLPTESIRVFVLDENWIDCLVDGAFSIGRGATRDAARETMAARQLGERSAAAARVARFRALGLAREDEPPAAGSTEAVTGFLLRSSVLTAWPGLEVKGFSHTDGTGPLDLIRFDRVADDIALCLFRGRAALVTFSEPAETLRFGRLPFKGGQRRPNLATEALAKPFTGNAPMPQGIHLHWHLPAALRRGAYDEAGRLEVPRAPDRWLLTRVLVKQAGSKAPVA